jgi:hypothetical protein
MSAVFRPKDLEKSHRKIIENALSDLKPETKNMVIQLLDSENIHAIERLL